MTIHFICRGNVLRSVIAEAYLKSLHIPNLTVLSSGSIADETRASNAKLGYITNTQQLLARHGLADYAKAVPDQLTNDRLSDDQLVICMNRVVFDDTGEHYALPPDTRYWDIVDIGEGARVVSETGSRQAFEEAIYQEITTRISELLASTTLSNNQ